MSWNMAMAAIAFCLKDEEYRAVFAAAVKWNDSVDNEWTVAVDWKHYKQQSNSWL